MGQHVLQTSWALPASMPWRSRKTIEIAPAGALTLADRCDAIMEAREEERQRVLILERLFACWAAAAAKHAVDTYFFEADGETTDMVLRWVGGPTLSSPHAPRRRIDSSVRRSGGHSSAQTDRFL
jgi:hypothetical protein